jgi:hypothetical protein
MLKELLEQLQTLKSEVESIDKLPEDQQAVVAATLAEKVLNILENATVPLPEQHSKLSGEQIPPSEF